MDLIAWIDSRYARQNSLRILRGQVDPRIRVSCQLKLWPMFMHFSERIKGFLQRNARVKNTNQSRQKDMSASQNNRIRTTTVITCSKLIVLINKVSDYSCRTFFAQTQAVSAYLVWEYQRWLNVRPRYYHVRQSVRWSGQTLFLSNLAIGGMPKNMTGRLSFIALQPVIRLIIRGPQLFGVAQPWQQPWS